ncbi:MAG: hypothetical protein ACTHU0_16120 [Kofleriaceae bacterium]
MKVPTLLATLGLVFAAACGDDSPNRPADAGVDAPSAPPDASCFENPQTHEQIINACTPAQKIYKDSQPPLLQPDGSLPPLPP